MKRLTLEEIGKLAGVSRTTVSRVINNHPNIREEVRARVQHVIAETGYQPNLAARSLASQQSNVIGIIIPNVVQHVFADAYFPSVIQGISQVCNRENYTLSLFLFHSREDEEQTFKRVLGNGLVDGVILSAERHDLDMPEQLEKWGIPFVQIARSPTNQDINYVDVDNICGGYMATKHLLDLGYRRIATIASQKNIAGVDRITGYQRALSEYQLPFDPAAVVYGDFSERSGYAAMYQLLPYQPDAIFAASDAMGLGAIRALREAGLSVPQDVAIVGFDNLAPAISAHPPLTTIAQPVDKIGLYAAEMLIGILNGSVQTPHHIVLDVELVIRESCGAVLP